MLPLAKRIVHIFGLYILDYFRPAWSLNKPNSDDLLGSVEENRADSENLWKCCTGRPYRTTKRDEQDYITLQTNSHKKDGQRASTLSAGGAPALLGTGHRKFCFWILLQCPAEERYVQFLFTQLCEKFPRRLNYEITNEEKLSRNHVLQPHAFRCYVLAK